MSCAESRRSVRVMSFSPSIELFAEPLIAVLQQLDDVIRSLTDAQYVQKPVGVVESSIGAHVRHCLDHVQALLLAAGSGELDYDHRSRGTPIECSRDAATDEIDRLVEELRQLPEDAAEEVIALRVLMNSDEASLPVRTTVGREMGYVLSHTIHHNALIGAMARTLNAWLPARFGYAPSTVSHLERGACAR